MKKPIIDQEMEKLGWVFNAQSEKYEAVDVEPGSDKEKYPSFYLLDDLPVAMRNAMIRLENNG